MGGVKNAGRRKTGNKQQGERRQPGLGMGKGVRSREKKQKIRRGDAEDKKKLENWKYRPSDDLYSQYKKVYDNPKYYNQDTGEINWPRNSGFAGIPKKTTLKRGERIDRYGLDSGTFTSPEGTDYHMRSVAPGTNLRPHSIFQVMVPINVKEGKIAPWFDEPGGGIQYKMPKSIKDLLKDNVLKRV